MKNEELRKICSANYFIEKGKGKGTLHHVGAGFHARPQQKTPVPKRGQKARAHRTFL